jgi:hypothetical protein
MPGRNSLYNSQGGRGSQNGRVEMVVAVTRTLVTRLPQPTRIHQQILNHQLIQIYHLVVIVML